MLNVSVMPVSFNELNLQNISNKSIVLDSIFPFYTRSVEEYHNFWELNNIDPYENRFPNLESLKDSMNARIEKINELAESNNLAGFDFRCVNLLKSKSLKPIKSAEFSKDFMKFHFDLRDFSSETQTKIKDLFLDLKSPSLVDFMEVGDDYCELICYKVGAFSYCNEFYLSLCKDSLNLLESFQTPKDNNFILARFIVDFAYKLKDTGLDCGFCVKYNNGTKKEVSLDEIFSWHLLSKEEKQKERARTYQQQILQKEAQTIAKQEIKNEVNQSRNSLHKESMQEELNKAKDAPRLNNIRSQNVESTNDETENVESKIKQSMELYEQKELEKTKIRLERARKDSYNAYGDLKDCLKNGLSILEAIKTIQQRYRNDDTINFATLLFSQDILNLDQKETELKEAKAEVKQREERIAELGDMLDKKEETISKLRSTMQSKINELTNLEESLRKEYENELQNVESKLRFDLEKVIKENENIISEYENELKRSDLDNENLSKENDKLTMEKGILEGHLREARAEIETIKTNNKETYKLEFQLEALSQKEKELKEEIKELKAKNDYMFNILTTKQNVQEASQNVESQSTTTKTAYDILKS